MSSYHLFKRTRNIRSAAKQMKPDAVWVAETRQTLLMQVKNSQPAPAKAQKAISRSFNIFVPVISFRWMRAPAAIVMAIIIALFSGSLFSVSAAEQALPGDLLYSIKLVTEQARIAMIKAPEDRVKLKTEFTERRVTEMKQVIDSPLANKSERIIEAAGVLKRDMNTIKNQLEEVQNTATPEKAKEAARIVDEKTTSVMADLQESKSKLSATEIVKVSEAQAAASDTSIKAIELLVNTHDQNSELVTEEEVINVLKTHNEKVAKTINDSTGLKVEVTTSSKTGLTESSTTTNAVIATSSTSTVTNDTVEETPMDQLSDAAKSFSEADKMVAEKNLDEAVAFIKVGTQQAFAAQKTVEEGVVKQEEETKQAEQDAIDNPPPENTSSTSSTSSTTPEPVTTDPPATTVNASGSTSGTTPAP
ncbi:MAG: DUF5667 domain-containing protein [Patescibacteria group bacterium]|nr:DUF5667 domain-containing protein [Patescibacteria group bacterium]